MNKLKIKTIFLRLSLFFIVAGNVSLASAFNSMCHSPVQLAALMSPNKPNLSKGETLRNRIKALEERREAYENRINDIEGDLGDTLSQEKLKDDPYDVASAIRSYIETSQSGWPCAEGSSQSNRSFIIRGSFLEFKLWDLVIPSASALSVSDTDANNNGGDQSGDAAPSGQKVQPVTKQEGSAPTRDTNQGGKTDPCPSSGGERGNDGNCICTDPINYGLEGDRCVLCSSKPGGQWKPGAIGEPCQCIGNEVIQVGASCRKKTCQERGLIEQNGQCKTQEDICEAQEGKEWINNRCQDTPQATCERQSETTGKQWNGRACVCPNTKGLENGICVECSEKEGEKWQPGERGQPCQCVESNEVIQVGDSCREKTDKDRCEEQGKIWIGPNANQGNCKTQDQIDREECENTPGKQWENGDCVNTPQANCEAQEGKEWINNRCQDTPEQECKNREGQWEYNQSQGCICPNPYVEEIKDGEKVCREKNQSEICQERGGIWNGEACRCPPEHKTENGRCVPKTEQDKCEEQEGKSFVNGECVDCPDWKKHSSFRNNGNVDNSFCDAYADDKRGCKNALARLDRLAQRLQRYNENIEKLEEELWSLDDSEDTKTEAGGLCFDCLKRELEANRPTAGQTIGNLANMIAGIGFGVAGYRVGQQAQNDANMLRIQQGYPASNDYYALQGASAGFPFLANGLYGMTRVNTPVGGWSCTPTMNPYGQTYAHSYNYGYQMPYY